MVYVRATRERTRRWASAGRVWGQRVGRVEGEMEFPFIVSKMGNGGERVGTELGRMVVPTRRALRSGGLHTKGYVLCKCANLQLLLLSTGLQKEPMVPKPICDRASSGPLECIDPPWPFKGPCMLFAFWIQNDVVQRVARNSRMRNKNPRPHLR